MSKQYHTVAVFIRDWKHDTGKLIPTPMGSYTTKGWIKARK
jgi:hypothetical protein